MDKSQLCEKCKYWIETGGTDEGLVGECRINAPSPELIDASATATIRYAVWPVTADSDWCGRFEDRPMSSRELLERVAMIEKLESERKARHKPA
jgi:hypothetical protein